MAEVRETHKQFALTPEMRKEIAKILSEYPGLKSITCDRRDMKFIPKNKEN